MKIGTKRIVSILMSLLMIASSFSAVFTVYADDPAAPNPMAKVNAEAINMEDNIGTANYYNATGNGENDLAYVKSLATANTELLNFASTPLTQMYTRQADNTYKSEMTISGHRVPIMQTKLAGPETGNHMLTDSTSPIGLQYGWDAQGYYYYDVALDPENPNKGQKKRGEEGTLPYQYETYKYEVGADSTVTDILIGSNYGTNRDLQTSYYELYIGDDFGTLYSEDNLVYTYAKGETSADCIQHYKFNEAQDVRYVGYKVLDPVCINQVGKSGGYWVAVRLPLFSIYGNFGSNVIRVHSANNYSKVGDLNNKPAYNDDINEAAYDYTPATEINAETNYSIPVKIKAADPNFIVDQAYYRNGVQYGSHYTVNADDALFDLNRTAEHRGNGRMSDSSSYYDDCWTDLYYDFGDIYTINEVLLTHHTTETLTAQEYTLYAANSYADLYKESSKLYEVKDNKFLGDRFVFQEPIEARYIGFRFTRTAQYGNYMDNDYLRLVEFNVFGCKKTESNVTTVGFTTLADAAEAAAENYGGQLAEKLPVATMYDTRTGGSTTLNITNEGATKILDGAIRNDGTYEYTDKNLTFTDSQGNFQVDGSKYVDIKFDLGSQKAIDKILVASKEGSFRVGHYAVYISDDETITEEDFVKPIPKIGRLTMAVANRQILL